MRTLKKHGYPVGVNLLEYDAPIACIAKKSQTYGGQFQSQYFDL